MGELFVTCASGFEPLLIEELGQLGIRTRRKGFRGVYVDQEMEAVYLINYRSRLATRVLWPLAQFACPDREALYEAAKKIDWQIFLDLEKTFAIDANVSHPKLRNSLFAALVVKDAICDNLRESLGGRPSIDIKNPDLQLNLFIHQGKATLSLDTSGIPLYKRGWRSSTADAPLQETLAAAILHLAQYTEHDTLCDPFCGSGTFLIEAAMVATQTPAGFFRKSWGFVNLPQFSVDAWLKVKQAADRNRKPLVKGKIFGADRDPKAVAICKSHLKTTGFDIDVACKEIRSYQPPHAPTVIVTNPPYGKRLEASLSAYRDLGAFARGKSFILAPDNHLMQATRLRVKNTFDLSNGGLPVTLFSC
jgi:putative N6-adenine-specific DNA methylase